jgi:RimJ/RimL family protein N-acetyltransferase
MKNSEIKKIIGAITNTASNSLVKRCGFQKECVKKEYVNINGKFEDAIVYIKMNPNRKN